LIASSARAVANIGVVWETSICGNLLIAGIYCCLERLIRILRELEANNWVTLLLAIETHEI
jgi:hypothetical protein